MPANKVKYNLKNVHYAVYDADQGTYGTPVAIPGAVSLSLSPETSDYIFYADGVNYFEYHNNNGYTGDLEIAIIPQSFKTDVLGEELDTKHNLVEKIGVQTTYFAFGFQFDGDATETLYWFYKASATRPELAGQTNEESIEVQTETLNLTISPDAAGNIKINTTPETAAADVTAWFNAVPAPVF